MNFRTACKLTQWTSFSPCSAKCGEGKKIRTRLPLDKGADLIAHQRRVVRLFNARNKNNMNNDDDGNDNDTKEQDADLNDNRLGFGSTDPNDPCRYEKTIEEVVCHNNRMCDHDISGLPREIFFFFS